MSFSMQQHNRLLKDSASKSEGTLTFENILISDLQPRQET